MGEPGKHQSGMHSALVRSARHGMHEHGKSMGEDGKHQARVHAAPIQPARHGKSMGKAWESVGNMRRDSTKNSALTRPAKRPESR